MQTTNPKLTPGQHIHSWRIIEIDPTGKRATCVCACHQVRAVAVEDLLAGARSSCGCKPPLRGHGQARRAEQQEHRRSRELLDWRPERGR
jgi:hypothetical protein